MLRRKAMPQTKTSPVKPAQKESYRVVTYPWWLYLIVNGTNVMSRVLSRDDGRDGSGLRRGVMVSRNEIKTGVDPSMITATTVIGEHVKGSDGRDLGKIEEVAMDLTTGTVSYFVLSVGGFFGFSDKFYAIPLGSLTFKPAEKVFYLPMDKKRLKQMKDFDKHDWPRRAAWPLVR
jgi:sporulation protein YlmC with PRC-barrel domain